MSETCSLRSRSSTSSSSRYRTVSGSVTGVFDESLFGPKGLSARRKNTKPKPIAVQNEAAINCISKRDIDVIARKSSQNYGTHYAPGAQNLKDTQNLRKKAQTRKEHMIRLETEKVKQAKVDKAGSPKENKIINLEEEQNEDI
eukprot:scaffold2945_cov129-Chaetoceros_neogracile.AAC.1